MDLGARVAICMGVGRGKLGTVIRPVLNDRGIPKASGAYSPMGRDDRFLRMDDGTFEVMNICHLTTVEFA